MDNWNTNKLPERLPFSKKRLPKRVIASYIVDYLIVIVLVGVFTVVDKIPPFHQPFSLDNYTLHYPFAVHERVPVFWLLVICGVAPAAIIAIYTLVIDGLFSHQASVPAGRGGLRRLSGKYRFKDRLWELNCGLLGLVLSIGAAFTITGALKNAIGKPRPDIVDRCKLVNPLAPKDAPGKWVGAPGYELATIGLCTQTDNYILQDGFKSFPSGHASAGFAGLFYLSLYLTAKLHVLDSKGEVWKTFIIMVPTLGAALIAGSRIMDARHHPFDVLTGGALGMLVAWGSYRQYFPPVSETWRKGRAYPIRAWGREPQAPQNPAFRVDEDTEPLRPMGRPTDVEDRGAASGFSSETVVGGAADAPAGNVFRQQIHQSQRRRQEQGGGFTIPHSDTMQSTMSGRVARYQGQMPNSNPFAGDARRDDGYDYSSSDEEESYELRSQTGGVYNPVAGTFADTGYHPPTGVTPAPTPPPANVGAPRHLPPASSTSGDIGETMPTAPPAVPPHATGTTL